MVDPGFIIAHDIGTSTLKTALVDVKGKILETVHRTYPVSYPKPNWAEQNPEDWWQAIAGATRELLEHSSTNPTDVRAIVFAGQMLGVVPVDETGQALRPAIIWLDSRAGDSAKDFVNRGWPCIDLHGVKVNVWSLLRWLRITGGGPSPVGKDPIWKIRWIERHEQEIWSQIHKVLDVTGYLVHRCSGRFVISRDSANLMWVFDSRPGKFVWHRKLLKKLDIPLEMLPEVVPSTEVVGSLSEAAAAEFGLTQDTQVVCGCGDVAAATVGAGTVRANATHMYIGTSGWIVAPLVKRRVHINSYTGSICHADPTKYIYVAEKETAGGCVEWFLQTLGKSEMAESSRTGTTPYDILEEEAKKIPPGSDNLMFLPWLFGERAPIDDDTVRGAFFNISLDHSREHFVRALFEGVALNFRFGLKGFTAKQVNLPEDPINIIGGGARSDLWCQIIADTTNRVIRRVEDPQNAGARGAALIAAVGLGYYPNFEALEPIFVIEKEFRPDPRTRKVYDFLYKRFKRFYRLNKYLFRDLNWFRTRGEL